MINGLGTLNGGSIFKNLTVYVPGQHLDHILQSINNFLLRIDKHMKYRTLFKPDRNFEVVITFRVRLGERKENVLYQMHMILFGKHALEPPATVELEIKILEHKPLAITRFGTKEELDVPFIAGNTIATDVVLNEIHSQLIVKNDEELPPADYETWEDLRRNAFAALIDAAYDPNKIKENYKQVLKFRIYCLKHKVPEAWKTSRV